MKKFIIGSLLIGLSSINLFGYQQCNGSNSPCDLSGSVINDGTGSGNFVKYSGSNLKQYTTFNLVGNTKPQGYTVARHTDSEIVLNMSKRYGNIKTGYSITGGVSCNGKPSVQDEYSGLKCADGWYEAKPNKCCPNGSTLRGVQDGWVYHDEACAKDWQTLVAFYTTKKKYFIRKYVNVSEACTNDIKIEANEPIVITPPTLRLSK